MSRLVTLRNPPHRLLALAAVNVVLGLLASSAFLLWMFRGDPVLAAVPAFYALPFLLLQPWFVPIGLLLPGGFLLAPVYTTAVSAVVYGSLERAGKLDGVVQRIARVDRRRTTRVCLLLLSLGALLALARYLDFPALRHGMPSELHHAFEDLDWSPRNGRYYTLRSFLDRESLWRATLSDTEVEGLAATAEMRATSPLQLVAGFRHQPPYWWRPRITDTTRVYATPGFPADRGPDGWHAAAIWNPEDEVLYMWIKDNF